RGPAAVAGRGRGARHGGHRVARGGAARGADAPVPGRILGAGGGRGAGAFGPCHRVAPRPGPGELQAGLHGGGTVSDRVADIPGRVGKTVEAPRKEFADELLTQLLAELEGRPSEAPAEPPRRRRWVRLIGVAAAALPFVLAMVLLIRSFQQAGPTTTPTPTP